MNNAKWENRLNLFFGAWLFVTPWLFTNQLSTDVANVVNWNFWIVGLAVAIAASMALQNLKPWEEWVNLLLGAWMFISPWALGYSGQSNLFWNSIVVGFFIAVMSGLSIPIARRFRAHP